jgi:hypothetical protein
MKGVTTSWKVFRATCIAQLILVAFQGMLSFSALFYKTHVLQSLISAVAYAFVFLFVYQGLSILNYNYPDIPLTARQKRSFNILYLVNFLLIAFLFAQVVNTWEVVPVLIQAAKSANSYWFSVAGFVLFTWIIFIIHLFFLAGMFRLRRLIHQNTISTWYQQFEKKSE